MLVLRWAAAGITQALDLAPASRTIVNGADESFDLP
jgi:hypothetical protein